MKTKKDLADILSEELEISKSSALNIVNAFEKVIKRIVVDEMDEIKIANFIQIKPVFRESRKTRNPKTNEYIMSKPKYVAKAKTMGKWFNN